MTATAYDRLPEAAAEIFGEEATAERAYDLLTVDVPVGSWIAALEIARDKLGCTYFDWLSAVDEPGTGFRVCAHVVSLEGRSVRRLLVRTTVPHEAPELPSAVEIYAGAAWHERETYEMFGVSFTDHPHLVPLLLPDGFEGHPLRKDFVLAARVVKAWPGAKEPGESEHGGPKRRQMLPPGVPDPNEWGPLKGQLPPAPARPARAGRTAGATGDRPPRRARSVSEGSASQAPEATPTTPEAPAAPATPRRARSVSEGSAAQRTESTEGKPATPSEPATPEAHSPESAKGTRDSAAPWHKPRPAFDDAAAPEAPAPGTPAAEGPAPETPAPEAPAAEGPAPEARAPEAPAPEAPAAGTPAAEAPAPEAPAAEGPAPETPAPEAPAAEAPAPEAPAAAEEPAPAGPAPDGPTPPETDESAPGSAERPGGDA
ncbi:NADH-quinone oxidoreductase subunit C [Streptomyces sp. NPDC005279]|uniref:NADH-quinone oxidoreductase subunit C n=1 Tax=Streptomyces sp. NPDC005279 TaxID=3364712 RepID=UPI0036D18CC9